MGRGESVCATKHVGLLIVMIIVLLIMSPHFLCHIVVVVDRKKSIANNGELMINVD